MAWQARIGEVRLGPMRHGVVRPGGVRQRMAWPGATRHGRSGYFGGRFSF